jgi:hypothetical protein
MDQPMLATPHARPACVDALDVDPKEWVPDEETPSVPTKLMKVCESCPIQAWCLQQALLRREAGYWAGTTTEARLSMLRRHRHRLQPVAA